MSDLFNLFAVIIVIGVIMWLINAFIPMAAAIKSLLNLLAAIVVIIFILQFFELIPQIIPIFRLFH